MSKSLSTAGDWNGRRGYVLLGGGAGHCFARLAPFLIVLAALLQREPVVLKAPLLDSQVLRSLL